MPRVKKIKNEPAKSASQKKEKTGKKRGRPKKKEVENKEKETLEVSPRIVKHDYLFAIGRRKSAIARVRYYPQAERMIQVNSKKLEDYFPTLSLQKIVQSPLQVSGIKTGNITAKLQGGGKRGQAESLRLGIARVLEKFDSNLRGELKRAGLLSRDARIKERKKYGLKRARRAPQWQKR